MAMSARVTNANGRIVAEKRNGQRRYHQHDALGNTIALIDDAGTVTNTFSYWPYGELRTTVIGNLPTPFLYCGQWGYYTDTTGRLYVRARTYRPVFTRWLTVDRLWPWQSSFGYANTNPVLHIDPKGMAACASKCCDAASVVYYFADLKENCRGGSWLPCDKQGHKTKCDARRKSGGGIDCKKVRTDLEKILERCIKPPKLDDTGPPLQMAGTIHCCFDSLLGTYHYCGAYCCEANMSSDPCWNFCMIRHEEYHGRECKQRVRGKEAPWREDCAYMVQAKCMFALYEVQCKLSWSEFPGFMECKRKQQGCLP